MADIQDPLLRKLAQRLNEVLAKRMSAVATGSASQVSGEVVTTGEKYAAQCAYIKAVNEVIEVIEEIDRDQYGPAQKAEE